MRAIYPIFQIISLGRVNPAGADERPAAALDDHLREPGQESPRGLHSDHIISDKNVLIICSSRLISCLYDLIRVFKVLCTIFYILGVFLSLYRL